MPGIPPVSVNCPPDSPTQVIVPDDHILNVVPVGGLPACTLTNMRARPPSSGQTVFSGWQMGDPGQWRFFAPGNTIPPDGTYFTPVRIEIRSSPGSDTAPWRATLISGVTDPDHGRVEITGSPNITPFLSDLLAVSGKIRITGTPTLKGTLMASGTTPDPLAPEEGRVEVSGNMTLTGNLISRSRTRVTGSATITYNVGTRTRILSPTLQVLSWSTAQQ